MAQISIHYSNRITLLSVLGDIDINVASEFTRALNIALIRRAAVAVDLCKVKLADPAILSCLQILARALSRRGQKLTVKVEPDSQPETLLKTADMTHWMDVTTDRGGLGRYLPDPRLQRIHRWHSIG